MTEKVEFEKGLTIRSLVLGIILSVIAVIVGDITFLFTDKPWLYANFFLPFVYIALINEAIGRIKKEWRLKPQELICIIGMLFLFEGSKYVNRGVATEGSFLCGALDYTMYGIGFGMYEPSMSEYWRRMTPSYMFPSSELASKAIYSGLSPGEVMPWGEFALPIIYWSVVTTLWIYFTAIIMFAFVGRSWCEVERLIFPEATPAKYLIVSAGDIDPEKNKSRLFDLKIGGSKVFWAAFLVGLLLSSMPIYAELIPAVAAFAWGFWGEIYVPQIASAIATALPGATALTVIQPSVFLVWLLIPNDLLLTVLVSWLICFIIYPAVAIKVGALAYEPGMEFRYPWENIPGWFSPFPYCVISGGVAFAIGLWCLWRVRDRFKLLASTLTSKDIMENGLSLRTITIFGIITTLALIAILTASGVPIPITIIWLVLFILWFAHVGRTSGEMAWGTMDWNPVPLGWYPMYGIGVSFGYWSPTVPEGGNVYSWFTFNNITYHSGHFWRHTVGSSIPFLYNVAYSVRTNIGDLLKYIIIVIPISTLIAFTAHGWLLAHGGGTQNSNAWVWTVWTRTGSYMMWEWMAKPGQTFSWTGAWMAVGFIVGILSYIMRMKFAWFLFNPVGFMMVAYAGSWVWINALIALIAKFVGIRAVGPKKFEQYAWPASAGATIGFGSLWGIAGIANFFSVCLPRLMAQYVP